MNRTATYDRYYKRSRKAGWRDAYGRVLVIYVDLMTKRWRP